jgi:guanine deaminase
MDTPQLRALLERCASYALEHMRARAGGPFGAVVATQAGTPLAFGANSVLAEHDPTAHAEVVAIRRAAQQRQHPHLADCILIATSYPCPMCMAAAHWARIPQLFYAQPTEAAQAAQFDDGRFWEAFATGRFELAVGTLEPGPATRALFPAWTELPDKRPY